MDDFETDMWWKNHWVRNPGEPMFLGCPMAFPRKSKVLALATSAVQSRLQQSTDLSKLPYSMFIRAVLCAIRVEALCACLLSLYFMHHMLS